MMLGTEQRAASRPYRRLWDLAFLCACWLAHPAGAASGGDDGAARGLQRMMEGLKSYSYTGTFVYLHGNQLETLSVTHAVTGDQVMQRLISLNGSAREVRMDAQAVTCVLPDAKAVSESRRAGVSGMWPALDADLERLQRHYLLRSLGDFRVAGRQADVVGIIPKDGFRYGYRFYLDRDTGLPLKTDLMGVKAKPLVQVMFTSFELLPAGSAAPRPLQEQDGFSRMLRAAPQSSAAEASRDWMVADPPPGFDTYLYNHWKDTAGSPVEHLVLSDGLASVSVYVEPNSAQGLKGAAELGAINAWGRVADGRRITAVGEVPAETVRKIAEAVRFETRVGE